MMGRDPPRRGDNIVHPGPGRAATPPPPPPPPPAGRTPSPFPVNPHTRERHSRPFKRWFPWLVPSFVVANVALFLITMYVNDCPGHSVRDSCVAPFLGRFSFQPLKENPLFGPSSATLDKMGALQVAKVVHSQAWRLISCIWLHAGVIHVLANMLGLVFIGLRLEQEFGFVRIGLLYVISGFGGSLLSALFIQSGISVGASGALFGLIGGMLSELLTNSAIYANKFSALLTLIVIIIINLAVEILILDMLHMKYKHKPYQYVLWALSFILLSAGLITALVLLLQGVNLNDNCSWCHYLSCVPTSKWSCKPQQVYCELVLMLTSAAMLRSTQIGDQLNMFEKWEN